MDPIKPSCTEAGQDFFQYSLQITRSHEISKSLDRLQRNRLNVNLVCFLIWYAHRAHGRVKKKQFIKLAEVVFAWNEEVVEELGRLQSMIALHQHEKISTIRSWLHDEVDIAQQMERCLLLEAVPPIQRYRKTDHQQMVDACYNLVNYCKCAKVFLTDTSVADYVSVLCAVFTDFAEPLIQRELIEHVAKAKVKCEISRSLQLSF